MSRISQDFINNLGFLYEHIHVKDQDFLNEESEYYDEEASELVEDIISTISLSMIYEGFSATAVVGFLSDSSEEEIIEKYLSFNESVISESTVSEEYIQEQVDQLNEFVGAALRILGAGAKAAKYAKGAKGVAPLARLGAGLKGAGTATSRVAQQGAKQSSVVRAGLSKAATKVKEVGSKAKSALTSPTAKKVGLGALGLGAAGLAGGIGGYMGAKLAGAGGDGKVGPKIVGPKIVGPKIVGPKSSSPSGGGGSNSSGGGGGSSTSPSGSAKPVPSSAAPKKPEGGTAMQQWAKANPQLAAKVKLGQSGYEEISAMRDKPGPNENQDQAPTVGKPEAKIDTSSVEADIKKEQERLKKKADQTPVTAKESYDAYDVILEYLIGTKQVDTLEEAHYVMLEMDSETVGSIIETFVQRNL